MKKTLFLAVFLASFSLFSQEKGQLLLSNGKIIFEKTITQNLSIDDLAKKLRFTGNFENIYKDDNQLVAELKALPVNYEGAGAKSMTTSIYIGTSNISAILVIIIEEQIHVTIKNIVFEDKTHIAGMNTGVQKLETYALKNGNFRNSFLKRDKAIIEFDLNEKIGI